MSYTHVVTRSDTFTVTHAKKMAAKVATDLKRIQRFYGSPSDARIASYEIEIIEMLRKGYVESITYGFQHNNKWLEPTVKYSARELLNPNLRDDDPGRIKPNANVGAASFSSYLIYSSVWLKLSEQERVEFAKCLPFLRSDALEPAVNGYFHNDLIYSSGGRSLERAVVRSY